MVLQQQTTSTSFTGKLRSGLSRLGIPRDGASGILLDARAPTDPTGASKPGAALSGNRVPGCPTWGGGVGGLVNGWLVGWLVNGGY